ncbi:MAG: tetratricopeptide repeat protein, partial [Gammaproteobacteria bacterium]|nr:tetratricopeptide repeat protein [Gammaproteobacteria bacterium]
MDRHHAAPQMAQLGCVLLCVVPRAKVRRSMICNHSRILAGLMQNLFAFGQALMASVVGLLLLGFGSFAQANNLETAMRAYETGDALTAAILLKPEAEQGVKEAQLALGYLYYAGRGVDQNLALAARWFNSAAENGEPAAMYNLAWLYETGEGVQANSAKRADWLRRAADAGFPLAQYELAQRLDFSADKADRLAAVEWYEKAAEAGLPAAKSALVIEPEAQEAPAAVETTQIIALATPETLDSESPRAPQLIPAPAPDPAPA